MPTTGIEARGRHDDRTFDENVGKFRTERTRYPTAHYGGGYSGRCQRERSTARLGETGARAGDSEGKGGHRDSCLPRSPWDPSVSPVTWQTSCRHCRTAFGVCTKATGGKEARLAHKSTDLGRRISRDADGAHGAPLHSEELFTASRRARSRARTTSE